MCSLAITEFFLIVLPSFQCILRFDHFLFIIYRYSVVPCCHTTNLLAVRNLCKLRQRFCSVVSNYMQVCAACVYEHQCTKCFQFIKAQPTFLSFFIEHVRFTKHIFLHLFLQFQVNSREFSVFIHLISSCC